MSLSVYPSILLFQTISTFFLVCDNKLNEFNLIFSSPYIPFNATQFLFFSFFWFTLIYCDINNRLANFHQIVLDIHTQSVVIYSSIAIRVYLWRKKINSLLWVRTFFYRITCSLMLLYSTKKKHLIGYVIISSWSLNKIVPLFNLMQFVFFLSPL